MLKLVVTLIVFFGVVKAEDYQFGCDNHYHALMERHVREAPNYSEYNDVSIDPLNVTFHLNTRQNPTESEILTIGNVQLLKASKFNSSNPTRIVVHGFCNCRHSDFCLETRQMLLHRQEYNVITLNWQSGKQLTDYWTARKRIIPASKDLAKFIDFLQAMGGLLLKDLYLVGHSLGAHLSGLAAKAITSGKVNTIVGLDPAKPLFDLDRPAERLADTDAEYVEVIHTNGGRLGIFDPIGHTDFYPNGGVSQPGCNWWIFGASCSHGRAWAFYAESVISKVGFWSTLCQSLSQVSPAGCRSPRAKLRMGGEPIVQQSRGILTVRTRSESPFAEGKLEDVRRKKWKGMGKGKKKMWKGGKRYL
ncbi:hypothetical protein pipiens_005303 [Culex pipiens pipiens]|uniref:Lipase domain-containing protein n=1 Tax=Culex pipiens pipiens TaxID=38569 RepID=A0ABD1DXV0_CULPP